MSPPLKEPCGALSVRQLGAKGNGTADDTAPVQKAIDSLPPDGGIVCFPSGTYRITATVTFGNGVVLQGEGPHSTVLKGDLSAPMLQSSNPSTRHYDVHVRDLQIYNTSKSGVGGVGIDFTNVSTGGVRDVFIQAVETGILLSGDAYYNDLFSPVIISTRWGIRMVSGANENRVFGGKIGDAETGIELDAVSNPQIYGTSLEMFISGVEVGPGVASPKIVGCRFENAPVSGTAIRISKETRGAIIVGPYFVGGLQQEIEDHATDTNVVADGHWTIGGGTRVRRHRRHTETIDFPNHPSPQFRLVPAGFSRDYWVPVPGAALEAGPDVVATDSSFVTPDPQIQGGIVATAIPANGGVYVRLANLTATDIFPPALTFTLDIWQH